MYSANPNQWGDDEFDLGDTVVPCGAASVTKSLELGQKRKREVSQGVRRTTDKLANTRNMERKRREGTSSKYHLRRSQHHGDGAQFSLPATDTEESDTGSNAPCCPWVNVYSGPHVLPDRPLPVTAAESDIRSIVEATTSTPSPISSVVPLYASATTKEELVYSIQPTSRDQPSFDTPSNERGVNGGPNFDAHLPDDNPPLDAQNAQAPLSRDTVVVCVVDDDVPPTVSTRLDVVARDPEDVPLGLYHVLQVLPVDGPAHIELDMLFAPSVSGAPPVSPRHSPDDNPPLDAQTVVVYVVDDD